MNRYVKYIIMLLMGCAGQMSAQSIWNVKHLNQVKVSINDAFYTEAWRNLKEEADAMLLLEPLSVMMKEHVPVSGDKHDYMSLARYFWPDPSKPDGLPYVNRDGHSNPELEKYDRNRLSETTNRITTLSLAWFFSGEEKYARKATELVEVWFLDKDTRMNPHFKYAQVAKGHNHGQGRCYGVLDGYSFIEMLDALALLESSRSFTNHHSKRLKVWFKEMLHWILTSPQGQEEARQLNNHGTAYDAQVIAFALYTGQKELAKKVLMAFPEKRMFKQIEPDGRQLHELWRTLSFGYSQYNLTHYIDIFLMAKNVNLSLDEVTSADGRSFYQAMDYLAQFLGKKVEAWPYQQIHGWEAKQQELCKDLYRTAVWLSPAHKHYMNLYKTYRMFNGQDRFLLLYVQPTLTDQVFSFASRQLKYAVRSTNEAQKQVDNVAKHRIMPRSLRKDGSLALVHPHDWCSGFFPGSLWQVYAYTRDAYWRQLAVSFTWSIEEAKWHKGTHDLGFMMYNSFGKAYDLTHEQSYRDVVMQSARTLITRYNARVGCIRSWDHNRERWSYPVIIDNLMNLELLFRATQLSGDSVYWKIAVNHANTTLRNHFRSDYSSYHVVDYDPATGEVRMKCTHQGYADDSFWSRGQGWGLYGYAMCYRFTKNPAYLKQSEAIADFFLNLPQMPADRIPYWDMKTPEVSRCIPDHPDPSIPRDASAAAVIASGLYELSTYVDAEKGKWYRKVADHIVENLYLHYQAKEGQAAGFLLLHSTGHYPANSEVDVPLNYADYYYLEALLRKSALE